MPEITWSRPVQSSVAVGSPNIDFFNLFDLGAVMVNINGLGYDTGVPDTDLLVQLSFDNATFDTTAANYVCLSWTTAASAGFLLTSPFDEDVLLAGSLRFEHWDKLAPTWMRWRGGRTSSTVGNRMPVGFHTQPKKPVGLRITNSLGYNWTTNNGVYVRQRQLQ